MFARVMIVVGVIAALGLAATGVHGYLGFTGRSGLERHILLGLAALLVFVTAHGWTFFYLLGLSRVLTETAAAAGMPTAVEPVLARFGSRVAPPIVAAVATALSVFVVGSALYGESTEARYHGWILWLALGLAVWATIVEWRTVLASERAIAALGPAGDAPAGDAA